MKLTRVMFCLALAGCANTSLPAPSAPLPCPDEKILSEKLIRQGKLPHPKAWPQILSNGVYGSFSMYDPFQGKELRLLPSPFDGEEQFFMILSTKGVSIHLEGVGLRQLQLGGTSSTLLIYTPPKDQAARKTIQNLVIEVDGKRFVLVFRPAN